MNTKKFRKDINALRALAVIAVVLFHFNNSWIKGGFAGVDVFFVISGFLMTSIIFNDLKLQKFNLLKFYTARANRIIPALAFVCIVLFIFGWFFLTPNEYKGLGKHAASSMAFISNLVYWKESGYFDNAAHEKWLLHTWSLSVEWQFYIIYPALLLILKRFFNLESIQKILLIPFGISLFYCIYLTLHNPDSAYYILQTRVWEMLLGGFAFLCPNPLTINKIKILQPLGLIFIFISYFIFSNHTPWPGYLAILPTLGAYLVIISNQQNSFFSQNSILQYIGKWSYSIYLWHWPLVVFGLVFEIQYWWLYGIPLSIMCGWLSYRYIEGLKLPIQTKWSQTIISKSVLLSVTTAGIGVVIFMTRGIAWHYPDSVRIASLESTDKNPYNCMLTEEGKSNKITKCIIGNPQHISAIVVGDSHADAITTSVSSIFNLKQNGVLVLTRASCPFILNARNNRLDDSCYQDNFKRLTELNKYKQTPIIISARWSAYLYGQSDPQRIRQGDNRPELYFGDSQYPSEKQLLHDFSENLTQTLCKFNPDVPVYIIQPIPEMTQDIPKVMSRLLMQNKTTDLSLNESSYLQRSAKVRTIIQRAAGTCGVKTLDPAKWLCQNGKCMAQFNGRPLYYDSDHLSEYGNKFLSPMFKKALSISSEVHVN